MSINKKVGFENDTMLAFWVAIMWTLGVIVLPRVGVVPGTRPDILQQSLQGLYLLLHGIVFAVACISIARWFKRAEYKKSSKRLFALLQLLLYAYVLACVAGSLYFMWISFV